ncbi:MAG: DUF4855 domain-containing protein, partial [Clostridia bacterium]|nr:DUF4855 domain-containing protein [Clostridia bacterium]
CRYVRFHFQRGGAWLFLDELSVYAIAEIEHKDSAEEVIRRLYDNESFTESSLKAAINSVKTGTPDKTQSRVDILAGKSYRTDIKPISSFPDKGGMLTDTYTGANIDENTWVGFPGGKDINITVPIGSKATDIAAFELHAYSTGAGNIEFPRCVIFSVSSDGSSWKQLARCYAPVGSQKEYTFISELPNTVSAKYVRFTLITEGSDMVLIDEVAAFAYNDDRLYEDEVYPPVRFPTVTENTYWPSSDQFYTLITDLIKGKRPQIYYAAAGGADKENNTPASSPILTDGVYASDLDFHGGKYFKMHGGGKRFIFFDLTNLSTVYSFKGEMMQQTSWAVYAPSSIPVLVSTDAVKWYSAGEIPINNARDGARLSGTLTLETPVAARFVCFVVDVTGWAGVDELEVTGKKEVESGTVLANNAGFEEFTDAEWGSASGELTWGEYDATLGAKDVYLAYHGTNRHPSTDDLLPIIGHLGTDGKYDDTMFDGALFLMSGGFPSGLGGGTGGVLKYNKSDAEWLISQLFDPSQNIPALESAAGTLKKKLNLPSSYKVKYYVSLYYPSCDNFGDIDGDGKSEDLSTAAGKIKVLLWWINQFETERAKHSYSNIEFGGYYWYNESMNSGDEVITAAVADAIHSRGSVFFWIPYFT